MYIQLDSQVLYYEKEGQGYPLLLLHGNGEDHSIFDGMVPSLKDYFTVYSLDLRGCGLSSPAKEYHYSDMRDDVVKLLTFLGVKRTNVLGFSDGGIIALMLGMDCPELVDKLVVCGANLSPAGLDFFSKRRIRSAYRRTKNEMVGMMLREPSISPTELAGISAKTMVVAGEKDMIKPGETKAIASSIPSSILKIVPGADHGSYIVHNDVILDDVIDFLL